MLLNKSVILTSFCISESSRSPLTMWIVKFFVDALHGVKFSVTFSLLSVFDQGCILDFVKCFLCIRQERGFSFDNMVEYFPPQILNKSWILGINSIGSWYIIICCWIWLANILKNFAYIFYKGYWSVVSVFLWLWYQVNAGLIKWKVCLPLLFSVEIVYNWYYFLFKHLVEFTSETIWAWRFFSPEGFSILLVLGLLRLCISS